MGGRRDPRLGRHDPRRGSTHIRGLQDTPRRVGAVGRRFAGVVSRFCSHSFIVFLGHSPSLQLYANYSILEVLFQVTHSFWCYTTTARRALNETNLQ